MSSQGKPAPAAEPTKETEVDPAVAEEEAKRTVFVGNLPYNVTDDELKEVFSVAGTVDDVNIVKRGTMSLGFGFIRFTAPEAAQQAVEKCSKQEVQGRPLNVELSRYRAPGEAPPRRGGYRGRFRGRFRGRYRGRRGYRGRYRGGYRGDRSRDGEEGAEEEEIAGEEEHDEGDAPRGRGGRGRRPGGYRSRRGRGGRRGGGLSRDDVETPAPTESPGETNSNTSPQAPAARVDDEQDEGTRGRGRGRGRGYRRGRGGRRQPRGAPDGPDSQTMLFVANLPFKVTDDDLKGIFADYNPVSAHVVVNPYSGQSKGFGFVEVKTHADQQRVLDELVNVEVEDRSLNIKVAKEQQVPPQTNQQAPLETNQQ